jgi:hypothetical protein
MIETDAYYRRRFEEELAAATYAEDPSISRIHLEMARRYRDMLGSEADKLSGAAAAERGGAIAEQGAVHA